MSDNFELETRFEIWSNRDGTRIHIGNDGEGLGLTEIRERGNDNKIVARITLVDEQVELLIEALLKRQNEKGKKTIAKL